MEIRMVYLIADVIGTMKMEFGSVPFVIVKLICTMYLLSSVIVIPVNV